MSRSPQHGPHAGHGNAARPPATRSWLALVLAAALPGQAPENNAGFGAVYRTIDLGACTGNDAHLGCADLGGRCYVSARDPQRGGNHVIYAIDQGGAVVAQLAQPAAHAVSAWGMRDLCTDGTHIAGGSEAGISIVTTAGALATHWHGQPIAQPIAGAALQALGVVRGLAWDGGAAGGAGRFYAANFESPIYEFDVQGNITATFANRGWNAAGLAFDAATGNLWVDGLAAGSEIGELDLAGRTCAPTGRSFPRARSGAFAGGLGEASAAAGRHAPWASRFALVGICQGNRDVLAVQRVDLLPARRGGDEVRFDTAIGAGPLDGRSKQFGALDTASLLVADPTGQRTGDLCWMIFNFPPDSLVDDLTNITALGLGVAIAPEHRTINELSLANPHPYDMVLVSHVGTPLIQTVGPGFVVPPGFLVRAQGVTLDPQVPWLVTSTNEVHLIGAMPQTGIVVEARGVDSFAIDGQRSFWRIAHDGGRAAIRSVRLDWNTVTVPGQETMVFDTEQLLGDRRHSGGNAAAAGCRGTWHASCDVATGLDYAHPANHRAPCAVGAENAGFSIDIGSGAAARAITYRFLGGSFAAGKALEFDCDTDGGLGVSGDAMRGLAVRVDLVDNTMLTGVLAIDPLTPQRAFVRW